MKKEAVITIKGTQFVDGDKDTVELTTVGTFYRKNDVYYLTYQESEATGFAGQRTTLKLEGNRRVTMIRFGGGESSLNIEKGVRHQCQYDTGYGSLLIGVNGDEIESGLTDDGGSYRFKYSLDINTALVSTNEIRLTVKPCESETNTEL